MLVLFDIDGTLILSGGAGMRALDRACEELHGFVGVMSTIAADGKTDPLIVNEIFRAHRGRDATAAEYDAVIARYVVCLAEEVTRTERYRILPGVHAALTHFEARGASIGLATGNVKQGARIKLDRGDLWRHFAFGGYGCDAAERAQLVARAIERGTTHAGRAFGRQEILVIGDTPRDVDAAHACGVPCLAVATGSHSADALRASGADWTVETLEEITSWSGCYGE